MNAKALFRSGEFLKVEAPTDPDVPWDTQITFHDYASKMMSELLWECADFVTSIDGVDDVEYEGGDLIAVWGRVLLAELYAKTYEWVGHWLGVDEAPPRNSK